MEQNLYLKYQGNIPLQTSNKQALIIQLQQHNLHLVVLLNNNIIYAINTSNNNTKSRLFNESPILSFKINHNRVSPLMFVLLGFTIEVIDFESFLPIKTYSFDVSIVDFTFFDTSNNYNLEIIYANKDKEIVYYSKGLILDNKKSLTKEKDNINEIFYKEPYLIWTLTKTIKIFNLQKKILVYKKDMLTSIKFKGSKNRILRKAI